MIKRTKSMTGITVDQHDGRRAPPPPFSCRGPRNPAEHAVVALEVGLPLEYLHHDEQHNQHFTAPNHNHNNNSKSNVSFGSDQNYFIPMLSPRPNGQSTSQRRNSADYVETSHFLHTCGLCNRLLASGRDIYMYMGDTAFCSLECREKQMKLDKRKENCTAISSLKNGKVMTSPTSSSSKSSSAGKGHTVAST